MRIRDAVRPFEDVPRHEPSGLATLRRHLQQGAPEPYDYTLLLGLRTVDSAQLLRTVHRGLSYSAVERFRENVSMSQDELLAWLQLAPRTLARRKEQGRLTTEESDRLLRAARILGKAMELFEGDRDPAMDWLFSAQPALGGELPAAVARTELGAREVENLIGRLEHGVYS